VEGCATLCANTVTEIMLIPVFLVTYLIAFQADAPVPIVIFQPAKTSFTSFPGMSQTFIYIFWLAEDLAENN